MRLTTTFAILAAAVMASGTVTARAADPAAPPTATIFAPGTVAAAPLDLGDTVNGGKHSMGAQLGPDHRTLYFYSERRLSPSDPNGAAPRNNGDDHIWQVSLARWLHAPARGGR
ncbi:hypothetical protein ACFPPA_17595 [Rhodanobacter ginsengisoli]|uniref:Uncharacterized protein n=1 Tax=Rhodanobacter ginsengisoli TaxID=418646 RepID=A0ABW0QSR4_9GAMM